MSIKPFFAVLLTVGCLTNPLQGAGKTSDVPPIEYAFTIWDWVENYRELPRFRRLVDRLQTIGFNTIELSIAWKDVQPQSADKFQWQYTDERVDHILGKGLRLRVRINYSFARPWPNWAAPQLAMRPDGRADLQLMTIFDDPLNDLQVVATEAIVARYKGRSIEWCPVFGIHTEHKLSSWVSYEPAAKAAFRRWLDRRYGSLQTLNHLWSKDYQSWEDVLPPVVACTTSGEPDLTTSHCDWIAFREEAITGKIQALLAAVQKADPGATTSVMLGERLRCGILGRARLGNRPRNYIMYPSGPITLCAMRKPNGCMICNSRHIVRYGCEDKTLASLPTTICRPKTLTTPRDSTWLHSWSSTRKQQTVSASSREA